MSILSQLINRFNTILIKTPAGFVVVVVVRNCQGDSKICVQMQKTQNSQMNSEKEQSWKINNT